MAGAGYRLFNTGDVLTAAQVNTFLMEQTVMVFNDAASRTTALSGVVAEGMLSYLKSTKQVEVYNGSAWVASDDPNAIQNTIVDAKGDLITATANDTPARLAVGNNGETLVADSSTSTGLRWQANTFQNAVYNSAFDIWQRGTSFSPNASLNQYSADRWLIYSGISTRTISRQSVSNLSTTPNQAIRYAAQVQRNSGDANTNPVYLLGSLETSDSIPFAGKTVTLSFYARAGANFSATSNIMSSSIRTGTGTDENTLNFTGFAQTAQNNTLTTSWQRFTQTVTLGTSITELGWSFEYAPTGTAGANDWFQVTGVQLEQGSVATPYHRQNATLAGELAACQRYYWRAGGDSVFQYFGMGSFYSSTGAYIQLLPPVTLRTAPSALEYSTLQTYDFSSTQTISNITLAAGSRSVTLLDVTLSSGGTQFRPNLLRANNSTSAYIALTAEL